jgi:hypothetical protein
MTIGTRPPRPVTSERVLLDAIKSIPPSEEFLRRYAEGAAP